MDLDEVVLVPIDSLTEWPGNPRRGNAEKIRESIRANGIYKPLLVQRGSRRIIVGNNTWRAAKDLGHTHVAVIFKSADDDNARRMMLADNRTSDAASYDEELLREALGEMNSYYGTGYSDEEAEMLLRYAGDGDGNAESGDHYLEDDDDDIFVLEEVPATGAAYAELPQQEALRAERQAAQVVSAVRGTREIMLVYMNDEHAEMMELLDGLRRAWSGETEWRNPQIVQRLVRQAARDAGIA